MSQTLITALWITAIGMGLVFLSLFLLWGAMELMVRLTAKAAAAESPPGPAAAAPCAEPPGADLTIKRARAAAAAAGLALALAEQQGGNGTPAVPAPAAAGNEGGGTVSAWQAANRAGQINQNSALTQHKVRGDD